MLVLNFDLEGHLYRWHFTDMANFWCQCLPQAHGPRKVAEANQIQACSNHGWSSGRQGMQWPSKFF